MEAPELSYLSERRKDGKVKIMNEAAIGFIQGHHAYSTQETNDLRCSHEQMWLDLICTIPLPGD